MPDTPEQNRVVERKNCTILDMVRYILCNSTLPNFLLGEVLRTAAYILNQVPSKSILKTSYKLWSDKKPSLHHFHIWGCKAEVRPHNPHLRKLDQKTISGHFNGYCIGLRGSRFYCPSHTTRIIESDRTIYFEDDHDRKSSEPRNVIFREECMVVPMPFVHVPLMELPQTNNIDLLIETKHLLSCHFDMKDLGEAYFMPEIQILHDRFRGVLGLSQRTYIDRVLCRFNMQSCSPGKAPIVKGDNFARSQCSRNDDQRVQM
ncbi:hypothetical protein JRO89_XS01G0064800 [Xanthoceras sorbifolium]|uniref:Retroviral polymerase SH3-like domain-containing protein n=1 Tax=Xanthoceras sorbifolium TaxID=99658 RepID=A0ABQ8IIF4_9ROSI|nr:hypothetical protein JRO89_XS01G0064800 [Xanthoceras sorbifolium]